MGTARIVLRLSPIPCPTFPWAESERYSCSAQDLQRSHLCFAENLRCAFEATVHCAQYTVHKKASLEGVYVFH